MFWMITGSAMVGMVVGGVVIAAACSIAEDHNEEG